MATQHDLAASLPDREDRRGYVLFVGSNGAFVSVSVSALGGQLGLSLSTGDRAIGDFCRVF